MKTQLFAPEIDNIIDNIKWQTAPVNPDIYQKLKNTYNVFTCIKTIGDDELRETWLEVERGPIEAFGNFEEFKESGEVKTMEDFEQLWKDYYQEETKWYKFQTAKFEDNLYFHFGGKLLWSVKETELEEEDAKKGWNLEYYERFAGWLLEKITDETEKLKNDADAYKTRFHLNCGMRMKLFAWLPVKIISELFPIRFSRGIATAFSPRKIASLIS
jgi:hypothetical protein